MAPTSTNSTTAAITTAARVVSGRSSNSPVNKSRVSTVSTATMSPDAWVFAPGTAVDRRLRQASVDHHARAQARWRRWLRRVRSAPGWRRCRSALLRRTSWRRPAPRRNPPGRCPPPDRPGGGSSPPARSGTRSAAVRSGCGRRARRRGPRDGPPWPAMMPAEHDDEGRRHLRGELAQQQEDGERDAADEYRPSTDVPELADDVPSWSKKSPEPFDTPRSLGTWPIMIVKARPMMKPLSTGSEMKLATKPRRARPATRARTPVVMARVAVRAA